MTFEQAYREAASRLEAYDRFAGSVAEIDSELDDIASAAAEIASTAGVAYLSRGLSDDIRRSVERVRELVHEGLVQR